MSDLSSSSDGDRLGEFESETYITRSNRSRSTRGEKVRRKFRRCMELFLSEGGSCDYDNERIGDIEFSFIKIELTGIYEPRKNSQEILLKI